MVGGGVEDTSTSTSLHTPFVVYSVLQLVYADACTKDKRASGLAGVDTRRDSNNSLSGKVDSACGWKVLSPEAT